MSHKFSSLVDDIKSALEGASESADKVRVLARGLRWQPPLDSSDLEALVSLGEMVQGKRGDDRWDVERAVYEILCDCGTVDAVPFLLRAYHLRGVHGEDRRRLALQGLSRIAAIDGDETALETLASALDHNRADTRGWAIGFLINAYRTLNRPLPLALGDRLRDLAEDDPNQDVRVEAATALSDLGLVDWQFTDTVIKEARSQQGS